MAPARLPRPRRSPSTRTAGCVDDGVQPLTHVLDAGGPDALAVTLEADGTGAIYPVLYTRIGGEIAERTLDPDPLLRYDGARCAPGDRATIVRDGRSRTSPRD